MFGYMRLKSMLSKTEGE